MLKSRAWTTLRISNPNSSATAVATSARSPSIPMIRTLNPRAFSTRVLPIATRSSLRPSIRTTSLRGDLLKGAFITKGSSRGSRRSYSTSPSQNQVLELFTGPISQFISTLSRIARMLTLSAFGVAALGAIAFEGTHQYVEHFAMRKTIERNPSMSASGQSDDDEWGWSDQISEESWGESNGTDPRLGIKGRHAVRSAWICMNWGGGISPLIFFNNREMGPMANRGGGFNTDAASILSDDGVISCQRYLNLALSIAESRGIRLPDPVASRAEAAAVDTPSTVSSDLIQVVKIDPTALALETKLAAIKERHGTRLSTLGAISGYERIFDAISSTSDSKERSSRMVRLATKLGDLNSFIGRREESEAWLMKAVELAGQQGAVTPTPGEVGQIERGNSAEALESASASNKKGSNWLSLFPNKSSSSAKDSDGFASTSTRSTNPTSESKTVTEPSPALTRALVSSLLSMSALYAQAPRGGEQDDEAGKGSSLEKALRVQAGALKLIRFELERMESQGGGKGKGGGGGREGDPAGRQLHKEWLKLYDSMVRIHLAETIYALGERRKSSSNSSKGIKDKILSVTKPLLGSTETDHPPLPSRHERSLAWLKDANKSSNEIVQSLSTSQDRSSDLSPEWRNQPNQLTVVAERILRDSKRVRKITSDKIRSLED
ncbi:hypothetical protein IE53DRAFT_384255 [Violaceomyces palustris]|uniref:Uncharacterized protein n=1 Tax=Violaceomyces palustris TaxID=1673888 RepID=A0ACD0P575_9BASI|nr:hypothetical protein IE53DRAFT_384255 [Violaceomyces palustris]